MSAVLQSQKKQTEGGMKESGSARIWGEYTLCPSVIFLAVTQFISPVESAMSHCSLWLTSHPDHPADYICSAELSAKERDRKERERERWLALGEKSFLIILHLLAFTHWIGECRCFCITGLLSPLSSTYIVFVSLTLDRWIPVRAGYLARPLVPFLVRCRLGHLSPDNEAVVPFSSPYSSLANCSRSLLLSVCDQGN